MDSRQLQSWFEERTAAGEFSGVALVRRAAEPLFRFAGGLAHRGLGVPITDDTRFAVASVTKLATGVAALRLVDRGRLELEQPVIEILPPDQRTAALTRDHSLHHLLSHTSGLPDYHDDDDPTSFVANWDRLPAYHVRRPADMLPLFRHLPAVLGAGARYQYNDAAFILVGLVLEAVTGLPYPEVVAAEVFGPAGMGDTALEAVDHEPVRLATGYTADAAAPRGWKSNVFSITAMGMPDGGMISTVDDLATLVEALAAGRLLPPGLFEAMTTPQGPADATERFGYACELAMVDGRVAAFGHSGSDPGVGAVVFHDLAAATTVAVTCNQDRGAWLALGELATSFGLAVPRA